MMGVARRRGARDGFDCDRRRSTASTNGVAIGVIAVSIDKVGVSYGDVRALDNVSLEIAAGEMFFLLGPSGCGKTTLLRSIAGFVTPDRGAIRFDGRDVTRLPPQQRNTAMMFQQYALWPHMTVEANVAFGLAVRKAPRAERIRRAAEALDMVRMGPYAKRKPAALSGGQQQRVALARALVIRPGCLLLDEPLSNLDALLRAEMRGEIRRLCRECGLTSFCVTHDQKEALSMADRMAVMQMGEVIQVGTPRELYERPRDVRVAGFIGETNLLRGRIVSNGDGTLRVDTPLGPCDVAAGRNGTTGDCTLSVRPESINIGPSDGAANRFRATVSDIVYLGDLANLTLKSGDATLRASVIMRGGMPLPVAGSEIACAIDPHDLVMVDGTA
jgi:iron(III) transport system ATP-binding protein